MNVKNEKLIIAIDGPSGAGKSTVAKALAKGLGYLYIDTGAMYRALALKATEKGIEIKNEEALTQLASEMDINFVVEDDNNYIFCNGQNVTEAIRTPEISWIASEISKCEGVRQEMVKKQRQMGKTGGVVLEGRDIGTVVFPDADVKFYLDADLEERARRRFKELVEKGQQVVLEKTIKDIMQRDHNDMNREHSPLRRAEDAILIDSTNLSVEEVVKEMMNIISLKKEN